MREVWEYKKLGEITISSDLGKTLNQSKDTGSMHPYLCAVNILWDKIDLTTLKETRFEDSELERYTVSKGDLLICEGGDTGRAAIWDKEETILYQNALHRVRFMKDVNTRFVLFFLWHLKNTGEIDHRYSKGVTIKHLVKSSLLSISIPLPPLTIQQSIVSELDEINNLLSLKRKELETYDKLAQSLFYEMFGDPVENEKGWEVKKLGEVCEIVTGSTPSTSDGSNWDGHVNWVTPAELDIQLYYGETKRKITEKAAKSLSIMPKGTVLLSTRAPIGKLAITTIPMCCNQGFKNMICKDELVNIFLYYYLLFTMDNIKAMGRGATFKEVSKNAIFAYSVILPPLPLQQLFAQRIEAIETQKAQVKAAIEKLETLLAARMQYWFD